MSSYLIIDGYNLIHKIPPLLQASRSSIDFARDELINMVGSYCDYYNTEGIIVYDGNQSKRTVEDGNPTVIYSKRGESADTVIESLVYKLKDKAVVRVVTDDRVISNMVTGMGAFTMHVMLFYIEAKDAVASIRDKIS